ncbi:MAG: uracil phosphoribosyltransferase [Spirochaetales bacterium]|jgi:uracil phosphoribosyltransferase|nr:uracil phosphoribosyltransferase [Spirochaetales bacterium]
MNTVILKAADLDGCLTAQDKEHIREMDENFDQAKELFAILDGQAFSDRLEKSQKELIQLYNVMGDRLREIIQEEPRIKVYPFDMPSESHGEASRLIAKLRDVRTQRSEFIYYIQRAYELLFKLAFTSPKATKKNYLLTKTPVDVPLRNYAVHKIPDVDNLIENTVMCVMLRGALLPSMIMSKEIQEYSSRGYLTPFALFRIRRDETKKEMDMEYILDLDRSFFALDELNGKDLIFADPMNATGGSLVTIIKFLEDKKIRPASIKFFNVIAALKGSLRIIRAIPNAAVYTLWMDPCLNDLAYIMPGLGDAGDRINNRDSEDHSRNIIQLIADYGSNISDLYRWQVRQIEKTVLG